MGLVDDDREAPAARPLAGWLVADLVEDERELLHRGDDDLLPALDEAAQIARAFGVADRRADLRELLDGVADLAVENAAVGDDDDRVEDRHVVFRETDQLVGEPGDGVGLAAARRMLDQVAPARAVAARVGEKRAHHVELVVARPDLGPRPAAGSVVLRGEKVRVVLQDVGQALAGEDPPPQVVGLEAVGIGRVAGPVVPAHVEGEEPGRLAPQVRTELHLVLVHREVRHAPARLEQPLARVAVAAVLVDRIVHRLLGEAVLELEGRDRQAVDEQGQVEGGPRPVPAVAKLPRDRKAVRIVERRRVFVAGGRRAEEQIDVMRPVREALAQHVDGSAPGRLRLQPRQELAPCRAVLVQGKGIVQAGLGVRQKRHELAEVHAVFAVVVVRVAADPAGAVGGRPLAHPVRGRGGIRLAGQTGEGRADPPFEAALGEVGGGHGTAATDPRSSRSRRVRRPDTRGRSDSLRTGAWPIM